MHIINLELKTENLAAQRHFYHHVLGIPLEKTSADSCLTLQVGTSQLTFAAGEPGKGGSYHVAFAIPSNQFSEAKAWLRQRVPLLTDDQMREEYFFSAWDAHAIYFADPDGNILELIAHHTLSNDAATPFDSRGLLAICEIGLATDDVPATVALLRERLGIVPYLDSISDSFAPVGDAHGLFIVVERGRTWFPDTVTPSDDSPVAAVVSEQGGRYLVSGPPYRVTPHS